MDPFLGEIRLFGFNYAPRGWATCDGQTLSISQNNALFALIGKRFGGDGTSTFCLPDLRGRGSVHVSPSIPLGAAVGQESVTLNPNQLPSHTHSLRGSSQPATTNVPTNALLAAAAYAQYTAPANLVAMGDSVTSLGSGGHDNMQPSLILNACIALTGLWPSRS